MGPRANFECRNCTRKAELVDQMVVYDDLPLASTRCPVCGFKRGFRRRFDAINVSTNGHRVAKILDPMMEPQFAEQTRIRDEAKESAKRLEEHKDHALAVASAEQREGFDKAVPGGGMQRWLPVQERAAVAAGAGVNVGAKADAVPWSMVGQPRTESAAYIAPHIRRRVVPTRAG
jgi:hypothetical protein